MACFTYEQDGKLELGPSYRLFQVLSDFLDGERINVDAPNAKVEAYAAQNSLTKETALLIVNRENDYYHLKIRFDGQKADLMVSAGLEQQYDYEVPALSVACLTVSADRSGAKAVLYTPKTIEAGLGPEVTLLKPW